MSVSSDRITGRVKWFNSRAGYGFITVCDGFDQAGNDIFVHFSSIRMEGEQYKYLVQGEYVEFSLMKSENATHEYHAVDITGIKGGLLMCQTQRQIPYRAGPPRTSYAGVTGADSAPRRRPAPRRPASSEDAEGFKEVRKRKPPTSAASAK